MANLINCQQVIAYTAEEFAGDTAFGVSTLELQNPPAGALETSATPLYYYLTIESESGYHIKAENINIGGVNGEYLGVVANGYNQWTSGSVVTGSVVPSDIFNIRTMDSLADNTDCSNKVIVEIVLQPTFVMPANDHFINIDFGGTAQSCAPVDLVVNPKAKFELFINSNADNFEAYMGYNIYLAKYFDSEQYASSIYISQNQNLQTCNGDYPPVYDYSGCWNDENYFNVSPSCLDSFQPTCYSRYRNVFFNDFFDVTNTNNVTTTCGALAVWNNANNLGGAYDSHPNLMEFLPNMQEPILHSHLYLYRFSSDISDDNYLSQVNYPFLVPGDGILPPYLCWYISVGNNSNWDLAASTETIDVWKIVSTTFVPDLSFILSSYSPSTINCSIFGTSGSLTSEKNNNGDIIQNNSNLDIDPDNIDITQIDNKTIKLKIPFQPGFQAEIWDEQFARNTKIFLNVYPTEI